MLENEVEGRAGNMIKDAGAYQSVVVGQMQSDLQLYRTLLPEYERNARLLIERLFEQTRKRIFRNPGVTKFYRPPGCQFRLHIPRDPEEDRAAELLKLEDQEFDIKKIKKEKMVPVMEFD